MPDTAIQATAVCHRVEVTSDAFEAFKARRYFGALDGLRCLSILAVLWHHTKGLPWIPASHLGFLGVDMFFVLSGFLIVTLLLREKASYGGFSLPRFYFRRTLRICPAYYGLLALLAVFFSIKPDGHTAAPFFRELPYYLTYTTNWIHPGTLMFIAWSLAAEEQFYLLWPPIEKWFARSALRILLIMIAINQAINFGLIDQCVSRPVALALMSLNILQITFTPICFGVLLAHVLDTRARFEKTAKMLSWHWTPVILLALIFGFCNVPFGTLSGFPRLTIQILMTLLLGSCVIREDHKLMPLLTIPAIRRLGVVSYGVYLYHMIVFDAVGRTLNHFRIHFPLDLFLIGLALTWAAAEASFRYYETPFLRLKKFGLSGHLANRRQPCR